MVTKAVYPATEELRAGAITAQPETIWEFETGYGSSPECLIPYLDDERYLTAVTIAYERNGFDWEVFCTKKTVKALRNAMAACQSICEAVLLEDVFLTLANCRADLKPYLLECLSEAIQQDYLFDTHSLAAAMRTRKNDAC